MISGDSWLDEVSPETRAAIRSRMMTIDVAAGQPFRQAGDRGSGFYQVESGYLKLSGLRADGTRVLIVVYKDGACFGESTLVAHRPHRHTTVALVDTRVRALNEGDFWEMYAAHPEIADALCRKFANALGRTLASRDTRAANRLGQMLAVTFRRLAQQCGAPRADGTTAIPLPLTQGDFAEHLEVTRQAVQRDIGHLKSMGIIDQDRGGWVILRPDLLDIGCSPVVPFRSRSAGARPGE